MNIFKPTTFTWEELGELKWAASLVGIAIGAEWPGVFSPYVWPLFIVGLALSVFPALAWFREH